MNPRAGDGLSHSWRTVWLFAQKLKKASIENVFNWTHPKAVLKVREELKGMAKNIHRKEEVVSFRDNT